MHNDRKREIQIGIVDGYNVKYGTLNKMKSNVIYIRGKAKIFPSLKKNSYQKEIYNLKHNFNKKVKQLIEEENGLLNSFICHLEMNETGMTFHKKSFIKYDVYIKPIIVKKIDDYNDYIINFVNKLNTVLTCLLKANYMMNI